MRREGFTLAETMAALFIIGLAMVGLLQGVQLIARIQRANASDLATDRQSRETQSRFRAIFGSAAADDGDLAARLTGGPAVLSFTCGDRDCAASLVRQSGQVVLLTRSPETRATPLAPASHDVHFQYLAIDGVSETWPPKDRSQPRLTGVRLMDGDRAIASARVWLEQSPDCNYDLITHECRAR